MSIVLRGSGLLVLASLIAAAACGSGPQSPFFGDERFLVLGVSPEEEANALSRSLAVDGRKEHLRLRGPTFTALGFEEPDGRPAWVRAITQRGIALALDPVASHPLSPGERYELIAPATEGLYDADGDGFDELIVLKRSYDEDQPCLLAYRIQNTGVVDRIEDTARIRAVGREAVGEIEPCESDAVPAPAGTEPEEAPVPAPAPAPAQ